MSLKLAGLVAGLYALAEAVFLILMLPDDDETRHRVRLAEVAVTFAFFGVGTVVLLGRAWLKLPPVTRPKPRLELVLAVAAALACIGQALVFWGLSSAGSQPLARSQVAAQAFKSAGYAVTGVALLGLLLAAAFRKLQPPHAA